MRLPVREAMADLLNSVDIEMRHDTSIQLLPVRRSPGTTAVRTAEEADSCGCVP